MRNLLKSEWTKLFHGRMLYVSSALVALLTPLGYLATRILIKAKPEEVRELALAFEQLTAQTYMLQALANLFSGGTLFIIIVMTTAFLITGDYSGGTLKYSLMASSRTRLIQSKLLTAGLLNLLLMTVAYVSAGTVSLIGFDWDPAGPGLPMLMASYGLGALTLTGFTSLLTWIFIRLDKTSVAMGIGIALFMAIGLAGVLLPPAMRPLLITVGFENIQTLISRPFTSLVLTGGAYTLLFSAASIASFKKKDILL